VLLIQSFIPLGLALISLVLCSANPARAAEPVNVVPNGGFEKVTKAGDLAEGGWRFKTAYCSEERKWEGQMSLKFPVAADDEKKQLLAECNLDADLFKAGDEVELSLYANSTAKLGKGFNTYARVNFTDSNWKAQAELKFALPSEPISEWVKLTKKFTIPPEFSADSRVRIQIVVWIAAKPEIPGAIYIDDVQVLNLSASKP
jgi:hypothetical protein